MYQRRRVASAGGVLWIMALALSSAAEASILCTETVTQVIAHGNGIVYFETSGTCLVEWCQISYATSVANANAYAVLLTAMATGKTVQFSWPNLASCSQLNAAYAIPDFVSLLP